MTDKLTVEYKLMMTKQLQAKGVITTCATCEYYDKTRWVCVFFQRQPPVDVIASGCSEWSEGLPF